MNRIPSALTGTVLTLLAAACSSSSNRSVDEAARPMPAEAKPDASSVGSNEVAAPAPEASPESVAASSSAESPSTGGTDPGDSSPGGAVDDVAVAWPSTVDGSSDMTVARVAGRAIPLTELVTKWILRDPESVRRLLDDLVLSRIMVLESGALGLDPPAAEIEKSVRKQLKALGEQARATGAPDLETFIRQGLGFEPDVFMRSLEEEAAVNSLAPRCVRAWLLGNDRREVRAITITDQAGVDQVQLRLARGDAFADVARELSTDPSKEQGGRIPPLVRGQSTLARAAFATEVGKVAGPIAEGPTFLFILVEAAPPVIEGSWADIGSAVEASLEERKVEDPEFWQWKEAMTLRYDVDLKPFLDLVR